MDAAVPVVGTECVVVLATTVVVMPKMDKPSPVQSASLLFTDAKLVCAPIGFCPGTSKFNAGGTEFEANRLTFPLLAVVVPDCSIRRRFVPFVSTFEMPPKVLPS